MENAIEVNGIGSVSRLILGGDEKAWHGKGLHIPEGARPGAVIMADADGFGARLVKCQHAVPIPKAGYDKDTLGAKDGDSYGEANNCTIYAVGPSKVWKVSRHKAPTLAYSPIQPGYWATVLDRLHDDLGAQFAGAIMLRGGARVMFQCKIGNLDLGPISTRRARTDTGGRDVVNGFATVNDDRGAEGTASAGLATTRAVCENTWAHAMAELKGCAAMYRGIRHVGDIEKQLAEWADNFAQARARFDRFSEFAQKATVTPFSGASFAGLCEDVWPDLAVKEGAEVTKRQGDKRDMLATLYDNGTGTYGRSVWDAYNAITEYANWYAPVGKGGKATDEQARYARLDSVLYNGGAEDVQKAGDLLYAYVSM